jgi:hypothetical protein
MVKRLELDATKMSKLTDAQNSQEHLKALVMSFKTLKEIDIFDPFDKPPYRARSKRIRKWHYPDDLLTMLGESAVRLKSWRWNSTFCGQGILRLKEVHTSNAFQSLRELALTKFHPEVKKTSETEIGPTEEVRNPVGSCKVLPTGFVRLYFTLIESLPLTLHPPF